MITLRTFGVLATLLALVLTNMQGCIAGALGEECGGFFQCEGGLHCCDDGKCHKCCEDSHCDEDAGERCSADYECVAPPEPPSVQQPQQAGCQADTDCYADQHCCDDQACHDCCHDGDCDEDEFCDAYVCLPVAADPSRPQCETDHDCKVGQHCCDDARCHDCCYDMHCDQDEECKYYECVKKQEPATEPEPEDETAEELVLLLDGYHQTGNWQGLYDRLHPAVVEWCGQEGSEDWVRAAVDLKPHIEFISAVQAPWSFHSWEFVDAWEVQIHYSIEGQEPSTQVVHFVEGDWFAPCPPKEEEVAPTPPPSQPGILTDPPGDPISCIDASSTGVPSGFWPDLIEVRAEGNTFYITLAEEPTEEFWGGVTFYFPGQPLVTDPGWAFNNSGNMGVNFFYDPVTGIFETFVSPLIGDEFILSDLVPEGGIDGNTVWLTVPPELATAYPQYWPISNATAGASATNFFVCDGIGYVNGLAAWRHSE